MSGHGMIVDQFESSLYLGKIFEGVKHGHGHFIKFAGKQDFLPEFKEYQAMDLFLSNLSKQNFKAKFEEIVSRAKAVVQKARDKTAKLQKQLSRGEWISSISYAKFKLQRKSEKIESRQRSVYLEYIGQFTNDLRDGYGLSKLSKKNNADFYKGQFSKDKLLGRGVYIFNFNKQRQKPNSEKLPMYYAGNFKDGMF